jgi:hypothetical protein
MIGWQRFFMSRAHTAIFQAAMHRLGSQVISTPDGYPGRQRGQGEDRLPMASVPSVGTPCVIALTQLSDQRKRRRTLPTTMACRSSMPEMARVNIYSGAAGFIRSR